MNARVVTALATVLLVGWQVSLKAQVAAASAAVPTPVFTTDIAPIISANCVGCHRHGGDAPFSLATFQDVRRRASQVAAVTRSGFMPPWKPAAGVGDFVGARRLSKAQIALLEQWAASGAPEGPPADLPRAPNDVTGWLHGEPDLILELPPYVLKADGRDVFRNFVVTVPGTGTRFVRGVQFRPRTPGVHHANIRIDRTPASRQLDDSDPAPGYEGLLLHSANYPDGHFLGWTPGQAPAPASGDMAWRLDGNWDLVVQLHMRPTGAVEDVRPVIGLYFTNKPPKRTPSIIRLGRQDLDIPAGATDYRVSDTFTLPVAVQLYAIQPHAHYRAKTVSAWAALPDGSRRALMRIDDWDFYWQDQYRYASPAWLPAGTTLNMEYRFDNSVANPRNPNYPPEGASWGWRSVDEMADVWFQVLAASPDARVRLQAEVDRKMLTEDAIGGELLLKREPNHVPLRNDTALIYMKLGKPEQAVTHFQAVTRLDSQSATAWYNEGVALEALGASARAADRYGRAIQLDPGYSAAHNNLGSVLVRQGQLEAARLQYEHAIRSDPRNAEAHANLAMVLLVRRAPDAALAEVHEALRLQPDRLLKLTPFVWLLVTHPDAAIRRADDGRALGERIVAATGRRDPSALDALAAAYAALGRFDHAIQTSTEALAVLADSESDRAAQIRSRIALYRARQPFTLPQ